MNLSTKQKQTHKLKRMNLWFLRRRMGRRVTRVLDQHETMLYFKQITNKDHLYSIYFNKYAIF